MIDDRNKAQNEKLLFFRKFLRGGRSIASFIPSTRSLATAFCEYIDASKPQIILELGCGTGAVTEIALSKMHTHSTLIAFECDPDLAAFAQKRCPRATVLTTKAENMLQAMHDINVSNVDVVLNGLPMPSMSTAVNVEIYRACKQLMSNSEVTISQLTLMPWVYYKKYKRIFKYVDFQFVWQSLPPGGVYHCRQFLPHFENYL